MSQQAISSVGSGTPMLMFLRRYLATLTMAVASLAFFRISLAILFVFVAMTAVLEALLARRSFDLPLYNKGRAPEAPLPSAPKLRDLAVYGMAVVGTGGLPAAARALTETTGVLNVIDLTALALACLIGSVIGVRPVITRRSTLNDIFDGFESMNDVLIFIELSKGPVRARLSAIARLLFGAFLLAPFLMAIGSQVTDVVSMGSVIIMISLSIGFQLGMLLISQALLGLHWASERPRR